VLVSVLVVTLLLEGDELDVRTLEVVVTVDTLDDVVLVTLLVVGLVLDDDELGGTKVVVGTLTDVDVVVGVL